MTTVPAASPKAEPIAALGSTVIFRGADGRERPALVTLITGKTINAVVFGVDHGDSEAGLKIGLNKKGDAWHA